MQEDITAVTGLRALPQTGSHAFAHFRCIKSKLEVSALSAYCARYPHIEGVDVSHNELDSLEPLREWKHLRWLNVSHNKLNTFDLCVAWSVEWDSGNKSLLRLDASFNSISKLGHLSQHLHLEELDLSFNDLHNIDALSSLRMLKRLNIEHNHIRDLTPLSQLPIAELNAAKNKIDTLSAIAAQHIKLCNVNHNAIADLACARHFAQLTSLQMAGNLIASLDALKNLAQLPLLSDLCVSLNPIALSCADTLESDILWILPDLVRLNGCVVGERTKVDSAFAHHAFDAQLRSIAEHHQNGTVISTVDAAVNEYELVSAGFAVCWERVIRGFPVLSATRLDFSGIELGAAGLRSVSDCIRQCPQLQQLSLSRTLSSARWSDTPYLQKWRLRCLCESLLVHNTLQTLDLSHCHLDARNFEPLAKLLSDCNALQSVTLNDNELGQHLQHARTGEVVSVCPSVAALTAALLKSQSLQSLSLRQNGLDALAAAIIGRCLQNAQCPLETLDLGDNELTVNGNGFEEIAAALLTNRRLRSLDISHCLRDDGAVIEPLLHALKRNEHLETLCISGNRLSRHARDYLALAMRLNRTVTRYRMNGLLVDDDGHGADSLGTLHTALATRANVMEYVAALKADERELAQAMAVASANQNLKTLRLKMARPMQTVLPKTAMLGLTTLGMCGMDAPMSLRVLEALSESDELTQLDLSGSVLDDECWRALTALCSKVSLKELVLRRCSAVRGDGDRDDDVLDVFVDFFHSTALCESLTVLDMADMRWADEVKPILIFEALFQSNGASGRETQHLRARPFRCDLTRFVIDAQSVLDCADCIEHALCVLSAMGVTELVLDAFVVDGRGLGSSQTLSALEVVNEIVHCFAQREFGVESLSLKGVALEAADDVALLADLVGAVRLRHLALPRIKFADGVSDEEWLRVMENLSHSALQSVELEDAVGQRELRILNSAAKPPLLTAKQICGVELQTADGELNRYAAALIFGRHCGAH